ncbi:MAG: hypothetical protein JO107_10110 [Hyphomicrobiales bacterium]|nr:hypothetical protein [Hyphomicrobiales bacterium]MBV8663444.1 hypothetical protein [Hyphomicrobiales bacterium]
MLPPRETDQYGFYPEDYVAKGAITLSPKALAVAKQFVVDLGKYDPKARWIAAFQWRTARTMRWSADSETFDEGPGIDLSGFRYDQVPPDAVEIIDGVPVIFILPPEVVAAAKTKTIVEAPTNSGRASFALE